MEIDFESSIFYLFDFFQSIMIFLMQYEKQHTQKSLVMAEPWYTLCSMLQLYYRKMKEIPIFTLCLSKEIDLFSMAYIHIHNISIGNTCNLHSISQLDNLTWPSHFIVVALLYTISRPKKWINMHHSWNLFETHQKFNVP